ncbi:putative quinol monooxygenase [Ferrovibrio sp. MS7]|uniref:putative quinol monooxygenase n=1 Tax=Ferrovibrio plantarum TaxID=3119164 RepID=UPI003135F312
MSSTSLKFAAAIAVAAGAVSAPALVSRAEPQIAASEASVRYGAIPAGAYAVVAEVRAKAGKVNELREATLPLVAQVRNEPNNIVYFLHEDRAAPGHFVFYEIFASEADFKAHNATPHVQAWFARLPELAEGGVTVTHMQLRGNTQ